MNRFSPVSIVAVLALASGTQAQVLLTTNTTTDKVVAFSPIDGSLVNPDVFSLDPAGGNKVAALAVGLEIWVSEQIGDRVVRYDHGGNILGVIGPTFPGGGFDNIRGMSLIGGTVYITNDGASNGATADSLVLLDTSGNHVATLPLSNSTSPFDVIPWQGDILVASSDANNDVHRYTTAGASVGLFHNSASLNFAHQISPASDGNVWCAGFSTNNVVKLDATTGAVLTSFAASGARGVYELQNGNVLWSSSGGTHVWNGTSSTTVVTGAASHFHLAPTDVSFHKHVGAGCHTHRIDQSNLFQLFDTIALAKTALDGNALRFTLAGNSYVANWMPGAAAGLYAVPTLGATIVANVSSGTETFTPSVAIPIPGGAATSWTVSSEGILTAGAVGNQAADTSPTLAETADETGLAFYTWLSQNPTEPGGGKIKWEEAGGVLYVTFEGVECAVGTPTLAPSTYQFQINTGTGEVTIVWLSMSSSNSTSDALVGCTLAGAGLTPASGTLATVVNDTVDPDLTLEPLTVTAAPAPVINPSTLVTYTITNIPETAPGSGIYFSTMFFSVTPLPGGIDLTGILTNVPGCNLYIGTLDVNLGTAITLAPTSTVQLTFSTPLFAPGNVIGAQAVAFFDGAFPLLNGENSGFVFSNGVVSATFVQ